MYLGVKNFGGTEVFAPISSPSYTMGAVTFTTGPSNTTALVYFWQNNGGTAYVDDLTVTDPPGENQSEPGPTVGDRLAVPAMLIEKPSSVLLPRSLGNGKLQVTGPNESSRQTEPTSHAVAADARVTAPYAVEAPGSLTVLANRLKKEKGNPLKDDYLAADLLPADW
jgi:hypothetical protein